MAVLVFDIGGIFVKLGGMTKLINWTGLDAEQLKSSWLASDAVKAFESGRLSFDRFASSVISEFALPINESELRNEMDSWLSELDEGADSILARVNERHRTVCLSNINGIQWPRIRDDLGLGKWFSEQFLSYEIGLVKPDPEIYSHVAKSLNASPETILFFDDSVPNVEGARAAGWKAHHVRGTAELHRRLSELKLF